MMAKRYRVELLQDELFTLCDKVAGLDQAVVVSLDGFVVASHPAAADDDTTPLHSPNIAATAASAISLGEGALKRLEHGDFERLIIEGEQGAMIIHPIGGDTDAALVAMVSKQARMGLASLAMRHSANALAEILGMGNKA